MRRRPERDDHGSVKRRDGPEISSATDNPDRVFLMLETEISWLQLEQIPPHFSSPGFGGVENGKMVGMTQLYLGDMFYK